ncbi:hypothetical protein D3C77_550360 [compost metagenome]
MIQASSQLPLQILPHNLAQAIRKHCKHASLVDLLTGLEQAFIVFLLRDLQQEIHISLFGDIKTMMVRTNQTTALM